VPPPRVLTWLMMSIIAPQFLALRVVRILGVSPHCRKNRISFWEFLKDRIYQTHAIPELQKIITSSPIRASPHATNY